MPGSPRIHVPKKTFTAIRKRVHATRDKKLGEYVVKCSIKKQLPRLRLQIHGHTFVLFPKDYLVQARGNKCVLLISGPSKRYAGADWILAPVYSPPPQQGYQRASYGNGYATGK
ncbi:hypothetical protein M3Y99_01025100 [Aphelenchoides fujianensis]|nr:hypothetical protein M3Y99_01025100 [Aphelenchoides fujianensis]